MTIITRDSEEFRNSSHRLAAYARAVLDPCPAAQAGTVANPVFAHVPVMQSLVDVLTAADAGFVLHGEHDFLFHRPIVPGLALLSRSTLIGARRSGARQILTVRSDSATPGGEPVATQWSTLVREQGEGVDWGDAAPVRPGAATGEAITTRIAITSDLTAIYADAARDYSPYTLDAEAAAAQGLPAPIVHGVCTLAIAAGRIVAARGGDPARLRRLGCRFSRPLFVVPGQELVLSVVGDGDVVSFTASDRDGTPVVTRGYAEFQP